MGTSSSADWETSDAADVAGDLATHIADTANPHVVTKAQVGLGNADNTSDADKPISTLTATALSGKAATVHTHALSDITQSGASSGQVPEWSGTAWVPTTPTGGGGVWGTITGDLEDQADLNQEFIDTIDNDGAYYFTQNASDLGAGRLEMIKGIPPGGGFGIYFTAVGNGDYLSSFCTVTGFPNVEFLPSGTLSFHVNALQTGGTKVTKLYAEFYVRTLLGVETLIGTSGLSQTLTGSSTAVSAYVPSDVVRAMGLTDRLLIRFRADVSGAGTAPDVTLNIQGLTNSRVKFPFEAVSSVNTKTGAVVLDKTDIGLSNVDNTSDLAKPISTDTQNALDLKQDELVGVNGSLFYQSSPGVIDPIPGWAVKADSGGLQTILDYEPNAIAANTQINVHVVNVNPLQDSPDEAVTGIFNSVNLDTTSSGFNVGTSGRVVTMQNNYVNHQGTGDIGEVVIFDNNFAIGNGVDPISAKGVSYAYGFGSISSGVTVSGAIQGYGFQPNINSAATMTTAAYVNAFYDYANFTGVDMEATYTSFASGPTVGSMATGTWFTSFNISPNIGTFNGTSGYVGVALSGNFGTFGTGNYTGININPNVTLADNSTGIRVDMSNVTGTNVRAMDITGDVSINGALAFTGDLSVGQFNAFYGTVPVDGGGNPLGMHGLVTALNAQNGVTTANADAIGVNTAMLITLEDNSISTSGAFQLGFTALALPCVVETHTGSSLDYMSGATAAINLSGGSTGGTIDELRVSRVVVIPNGITTINRSMGFFYHEPFGGVATESWGIYIANAQKNYLESPLKIGGSDSPGAGFILHAEGSTKIEGKLEHVAGNLGFFGATAVAQQASSGAVSAGGTYTATEQTMIQEMYNALRTYGLLT